MDIRRIKATDTDCFIKLWQSICDEGLYFQSPPLARDKIYTILQQVESELIPQFVVEIEGKIIASIEVFPRTIFDPEAKADNVGFLGIQVHKNSAKKGSGIS